MSKRWDLVFNIAEGLRGIGREAQVPAILDAYNIPYTFSDPLVLAVSLHKGMTKRILRDLRIPTPNFYEVNTVKDICNVNLNILYLLNRLQKVQVKEFMQIQKLTMNLN